MHFHLEVEDDGTLLVLRLGGELDLATVPQVQAAVERHCRGRRVLVIDLRALEFMDSSGIHLMMQLQGRQDGTAVAFVAPAEQHVSRLFDMTGVRATLNWVSEPCEALGERVDR